MDKRLGTILHLWHFITRPEQSQANSSTLVQPLPPQCWTHVHAIFLEFQHCIRGGATRFEVDNRAFLKLCFKDTEINAITQVSLGILSTIV